MPPECNELLLPTRGGAGIYACVKTINKLRLQPLRSKIQKSFTRLYPFVILSEVGAHATAKSKNLCIPLTFNHRILFATPAAL